MIRFLAGLALVALALPAPAARADDGASLVGQGAPTLRLKPYMIQGERIRQDEFPGRVVWVELYQFG